jgi:hypothetical protein
MISAHFEIYDQDDCLRRLAQSEPLLRRLPELQDVPFSPAPLSELNAVVFAGDDMVIKMPLSTGEYARSKSFFESEVVAELNTATTPPPLAIPKFMDMRWEPPYHALYRKVPGQVLTNADVKRFSVAEKQAFGRKIGSFIAWLGEAMSLDAYSGIVDALPNLQLGDRIDNMRYYAQYGINDTLDDTLSEVLIDTWLQYRQLHTAGKLKPTMVGHDDLRIANMTFVRQAGLWHPHGVFDFDITKPSSGERELRHIMPLGPAVIEPAVEAYEAASGQSVDESVLRFWAIGQVASAAAAFAVRNNASGLAERLIDLRYLCPERDWEGLERLLG